jgi:methionyl-tRNA formyltransferase
LNITVLANRDLASNFALNHLLPQLCEHHRVTVFLSDQVGGGRAAPDALEQLKFFEQTLFNDILFPLIDVGSRQGELLTFQGLAELTEGPVASLNRINSPESLERLRKTTPNLVLSIRYGGILREEAIAIPSSGVINLHSGLLPRYRGVMATFRALLAGDEEIGTTIHYISDPGIDTGEVIAHTRAPVEAGRSYLSQVLALYPPACEALLALVSRVSDGQRLSTASQSDGGQYFSFPTQAELEAFQGLGLRLYDPEEVTEVAKRYTEQL